MDNLELSSWELFGEFCLVFSAREARDGSLSSMRELKNVWKLLYGPIYGDSSHAAV